MLQQMPRPKLPENERLLPRITVRTDKETAEAARAVAREMGVSVSDLVRILLIAAVDHRVEYTPQSMAPRRRRT